MELLKPLCCSLLLVCAGCANRAFYHPDHAVYSSPAKDGYSYEEVRFASADGTRLSGWFIPAQGKALGTVVHFHGNARNMSSHYGLVSFIPAMGFNLFTFDYRGYGNSEGKPDRKGIYEDSVAAIRYVQSRPDVDPGKLILLGQSLGGANAIVAAGCNRFTGIRGIVIDSTFYSYRRVAKDHLSGTSVSLIASPLTSTLVSDGYNPGDVVDRISPVPIVFIHGTADTVTPYSHGRKLFEKAGEPKELWTIQGGGHIQAFTRYKDDILPRLRRFLLRCVGAEPV